MSVLVTGATGRVGSRFAPRLLDQGEEIRVLVRDPARAEAARSRGAEVITGDIRDPRALERAVDGVDAVVNLAAAFRGVPDEAAEEVNRDAAVELARAALAAGVGRFVHASTNLVYGPGRGRPAREEDDLRPGHTYPQTKAAAEHMLRRLHQSQGLGLRILRLAFVYGERDPHLAESMMWARGWALHQRLQLVHHADVGQAVMRALRAEGVDGRTYNVADDAPVSSFELHTINGESPADDAGTRSVDDPWSGIVDTSRIRTELGFRPIFPSVYAAKDAGAL
jgi:nucleoside-diphosphate-sugar epimerase